jgi:gliding motility-associated-like protein
MNKNYIYRKKRFVKSHFNIGYLVSVILLACSLLKPCSVYSQVSFLNKGMIYNNNNMFVINGDVTHQQDGSIVNSGNFYIRGNWTNDNPTSQIFTCGANGWVHLDSAIQSAQVIGGSTITRFNNLELSGVGSKQLSGIDTHIEDTLALNDKDFEAGDNTVFMLSADVDIVTRTSGFVSNTNDGGLSRNTTTGSTYLFPVGSSVGTTRYRPVEISPGVDNTFKVRMANIDATVEGYDLQNKENTIAGANVNFYHRISTDNPTLPADVTVYYDEATDGTYDIMAQWQNQWKNVGIVSATSNYGLSGITKAAHTDFYTSPFVLAEVIPSVFVANVFSPNGDGSNDVLHILGNGIDEVQFSIYDRWGEKVFETTSATDGWDGTFRGKPMNVGVFVYFIKGKYKNGESIDKNGNVTLLR